MLDLRRLRLLRELEARGTLAAVADALGYSPSAVSQQLAVLEREAGVALLEPAGRGVRLTDAGRVLAGHAGPLLAAAERAQADLDAAAGTVAGRIRLATFQSVALNLAAPAFRTLASEHPDLRTELVEAEPEESLPALALGDLDVVIADEWQDQVRPRLPALDREDLFTEPLRIVLPEDHPLARRRRVRLADLRDEPWATGQPGTGYADMTVRACRELGGFEPDLRHRANDAAFLLVAVRHGLAVTLLPDLVGADRHPGVVVRDVAEGAMGRTIFLASRATDRRRPSVQATLAAIREAAQRRAGRGGRAPGA